MSKGTKSLKLGDKVVLTDDGVEDVYTSDQNNFHDEDCYEEECDSDDHETYIFTEDQLKSLILEVENIRQDMSGKFLYRLDFNGEFTRDMYSDEIKLRTTLKLKEIGYDITRSTKHGA